MEYHAPTSIEEVSALLTENSAARVLAGGTDLLVQMRSGLVEPSQIIDIKALPGITAVELNDQGLTLGAAAPAQSITEREDIKAVFPGLVEAVDLIGSTQVQGRCSVGGNLCNASPAADSVPALIANGAICNIVGSQGERQVAAEAFNTGPGQNCLGADEILLSLFVPAPAERTSDAYLRFIPRTEMDIAVVGAGVSLTLDEDGICRAARVGIGAVAPTALLVEQSLVGAAVDDAALDALAAAASAASSPISDKRASANYRRKVVGVMARRAATIALARITEEV